MRWLRRLAVIAVIAAVGWLAALVIGGFALEGATRRGVAERIAESLHAEATIASGSLALVRGGIDLDALSVRRDDAIGHLALRVATVRCALPPLGLALIDRDCRELAVRGAQLELSTAALFQLRRPKRPPLRAARVVIDDARLELSPSALVPSLGRVVVAIEHAEAGETVFKTPLSFVFALRSLRATVELPGDITLRLSYDAGQLQLAGGLLGATLIALPVSLPIAELADDPAAELAKLIAFGKDLAERVVTQRAADWLKSKLSPP